MSEGRVLDGFAITAPTLALAVEKGLVTAGQADALRSLAVQEQRPPDRREPARDDEALRFVSGFADIFVTIGLVLFLGAAAYLANQAASDAATGALVAVLAWGLGEYFTRRRRLALPSIALLLAFTAGSYTALSGWFGGDGTGFRFGWIGDITGIGGRAPVAAAGAAIVTAALASLHFWRFRVPISIAAAFGALLAAVLLGLAGVAPDATRRFINGLLLAGGLAAFVAAMRFDLADPARRTRRTDIAFWLHLLAAPLIVHSIFAGLGLARHATEPVSAVAILLIFAILSAVAIAVDRRAILVSGLAYAGAAFGGLIARAGLTDRTVPVTLLVLGALVLLLSAGWQPLRRAILARFPPPLTDRLPPAA